MVRRGRGALRRKLLRDMRQNFMQFFALMMLCFLGTWVFTGLDANWRMEERTFETWIDEGRLADLWVRSTGFTKQDIARIRRVPGVQTVQERITLSADAPDLDGKVSVTLHACRGEAVLNVPVVRSGKALAPSDARGCLVEEQFAAAQGLSPGDRLTLEVGGVRFTFVVRGTVLSPEYMITVKDMAPDPSTYGYVLLSSEAFPALPFNELTLGLDPDADAEAVEDAVVDIVPQAMVVSQRKTHGSTVQVRGYVTLFRSLSYLFPVLAYFVAALVVVTTLSRMMDTQRTQMGTMKALGYTNRQIRAHYVQYALWPSVLGSALGLVSGQYNLPPVLWQMLATNTRVPRVLMAPISPMAWVMAAAEVLMSVFICIRHINRSARESTADLLRPKPPKSGARILLERWTGLWRRFSFNAKMIVRNLFRNKGRTMMSMVGMLFCNMLIICSFGLQDSIPYFVHEQFYGTFAYDTRADLKAGEAGTLESYRARLPADAVDGVMELSVTLDSPTASKTVLLNVLDDSQTTLRLGPGATVLPMPSSGLVLTEKLARQLGVKPGDRVELWLTGETEPVRLEVKALGRANVGQNAYMGRAAWERLHKGAFTPTALLLRAPSDRVRARLEDMDEVNGLKYPESQYHQTMRIMDSAAGAFTILSAVALGLAFVICYNMGLMNFTERTREYATLKVLGYHQREIRRLMLRENDLTAVIGVAAGIVPGILLVRVILRMCEFESMVFVPYVSWQTIVLSSLATFAFTWLIEWLLTRKVRGIDMVEALKSVE